MKEELEFLKGCLDELAAEKPETARHVAEMKKLYEGFGAGKISEAALEVGIQSLMQSLEKTALKEVRDGSK